MVNLSSDEKDNFKKDNTIKDSKDEATESQEKELTECNIKSDIKEISNHRHGKNISMAILLAFIPGIFGFLGLGHFYCKRFRPGFVYLLIGLLTFFVIFLCYILFNNLILLIVIFIGYLILLIWQIYDVKSIASKYNLENMTQYTSNNNNNKDKISIEVEFPKITYYNLGLSLIEMIARNRIVIFYSQISMYSMPAITALALFLMVSSTIILIQDETVERALENWE